MLCILSLELSIRIFGDEDEALGRLFFHLGNRIEGLFEIKKKEKREVQQLSLIHI